MGGFFTCITSPTLIMRAGLACAPLMHTLPFLHASAAMVRVLKIRAAHIHLSILASAIVMLCIENKGNGYFLLYWFIVMLSPAKQKLLIISPAVSKRSGICFTSSSPN